MISWDELHPWLRERDYALITREEMHELERRSEALRYVADERDRLARAVRDGYQRDDERDELRSQVAQLRTSNRALADEVADLRAHLAQLEGATGEEV